jgi:hypothetical protein
MVKNIFQIQEEYLSFTFNLRILSHSLKQSKNTEKKFYQFYIYLPVYTLFGPPPPLPCFQVSIEKFYPLRLNYFWEKWNHITTRDI